MIVCIFMESVIRIIHISVMIEKRKYVYFLARASFFPLSVRVACAHRDRLKQM